MKKIFLLICTVLLGVSAFAQEISLVTNGEGATKDAATASALRSAIEQAFGVFVSANTTILNDDIVRDEVATVASGNIKSYKELSCVQNKAGIYNVSVNAVVSIGKLISYAKSHGSSAEFAGQTFAMNMKMRELNKKNEYEALQNLLVQLRTLQDDLFDFKIEIGSPQQYSEKGFLYELFLIESSKKKWRVPITIYRTPNLNYERFLDALVGTLRSLKLSTEEREEYRKNNMSETFLVLDLKRIELRIKLDDVHFDWIKTIPFEICGYALRNSNRDIENFAYEIRNILRAAQTSYVLKEKGGAERELPLSYSENLDVCVSKEVLPQASPSYSLRYKDIQPAYNCITITTRTKEIHRKTINGYDPIPNYPGKEFFYDHASLPTSKISVSDVVYVNYETAEDVGKVIGFEIARPSPPEEGIFNSMWRKLKSKIL